MPDGSAWKASESGIARLVRQIYSYVLCSNESPTTYNLNFPRMPVIFFPLHLGPHVLNSEVGQY
jgi:hypothetical protein